MDACTHKAELKLSRSWHSGAACGAIRLQLPAGRWAVSEDLGENLPPFASPEMPLCDALPSFASRLCPEAAARLNTNHVFWKPALFFPACHPCWLLLHRADGANPSGTGSPQPGALSTHLHAAHSHPQLLQGIVTVHVC